MCGICGFLVDGPSHSGALNWLIDRVIALIQAGDAPPAGQ